MKSALAISGFVIVSSLLPCASRSSDRPTNYEVVSSHIDSLVNVVTGILRKDSITSLDYRSARREIDEFVHQRVSEGLLGKGIKLLSDSASTASMRVTVPLMEVSYSAPVSSHVFGSSDVIRSIHSEYSVEIVLKDQVAFSKSLRYSYVDTISESEITELESGSYSFLRGKFENSGILDDILQPILFVAAAGVIVYLFFTLRGS
ncbi:MAG TPA: hypothetical protein VIS48_14630 [Candidatus Kryptonia bacterium]